MKNKIAESLCEFPIVAAIKDFDGLEKCLKSESPIVFILFGDICNISSIVKKIKEAGKLAFIHIDLIEGLSNRDVAVDFIAKSTDAEGIISTRPNQIKHAKSLGLTTIQRFFLIDSMALDNIPKHISMGYVDLIEILPGVMPKVIREVSSRINIPVIAGGLIKDKEDIIAALDAGATAISSSNSDVWFM